MVRRKQIRQPDPYAEGQLPTPTGPIPATAKPVRLRRYEGRSRGHALMELQPPQTPMEHESQPQGAHHQL